MKAGMIERQLIEKAAAAILGSERLALACHVGPDGDALGSMIGFGLAAVTQAKKSWRPLARPSSFRPISPSFLLIS